jgi:hypothetical protein
MCLEPCYMSYSHIKTTGCPMVDNSLIPELVVGTTLSLRAQTAKQIGALRIAASVITKQLWLYFHASSLDYGYHRHLSMASCRPQKSPHDLKL